MGGESQVGIVDVADVELAYRQAGGITGIEGGNGGAAVGAVGIALEAESHHEHGGIVDMDVGGFFKVGGTLLDGM